MGKNQTYKKRRGSQNPSATAGGDFDCKFEAIDETGRRWTVAARTPREAAHIIKATKKMRADAGLTVGSASPESRNPEIDDLSFFLLILTMRLKKKFRK